MALFETATLASKTPSSAPLLEPGGYNARIVRVVDIGKQPGSLQYPTPMYHLMITFELLDEFMHEVDDKGVPIMVQDPDGEPGEMIPKIIPDKPRWFDFDFTYNPDGYMSENSHISKLVKAIDGLHVEPNVEQGIVGHAAKPPSAWPGEPLVVGLIHYTPKSGKNAGKVQNKISTFSPMKSKDKKTAPALVNSPLFFDLGNPTLEVFNKLQGGDNPYAIKNRILANLEFQGSKLQALLSGGTSVPAATPNTATQEEVDEAMKAELAAQKAAADARAQENAANQGERPF